MIKQVLFVLLVSCSVEAFAAMRPFKYTTKNCNATFNNDHFSDATKKKIHFSEPSNLFDKHSLKSWDSQNNSSDTTKVVVKGEYKTATRAGNRMYDKNDFTQPGLVDVATQTDALSDAADQESSNQSSQGRSENRLSDYYRQVSENKSRVVLGVQGFIKNTTANRNETFNKDDYKNTTRTGYKLPENSSIYTKKPGVECPSGERIVEGSAKIDSEDIPQELPAVRTAKVRKGPPRLNCSIS